MNPIFEGQLATYERTNRGGRGNINYVTSVSTVGVYPQPRHMKNLKAWDSDLRPWV